jgi:protein-arginine kinase activator protein McsA
MNENTACLECGSLEQTRRKTEIIDGEHMRLVICLGCANSAWYEQVAECSPGELLLQTMYSPS